MLLKILVHYLQGFVNITVEGFFVERLVNSCIQQQIFLWRLKRKNGTLVTVNISRKDFKKVCKIARKTGCKITIHDKKGLPTLLHRYRKRKILVILLLPILIAILFSSQYVWNITISGNKRLSQEEILTSLEEEGLTIGKRKKSLDSKKIIQSIRLKRKDISWMSIDMKGTNIIVNIVEAEQKPTMMDADKNCNIVANQEGMITKITADIGTALVKKGDIVKKGDLLIGGYMEGKFTQTRNVHAKGEVYAKVWHTKKKETGFTREIQEETGKFQNKYTLCFHNFKINLYKTLPKFEIYDTIKKSKCMKLFSNFYLPISIEKTTYVEKKSKEITYGKEELQTILIQELETEFEQEGSKEWKVANKLVHFYEPEENKLEIEMTYEVIENIGVEAE